MDVSAIVALGQSIGVLKTLAQGLVNIHDMTKLGEVRLEFLNQISAAVSAEIEIKQDLAKLRQENEELRTKLNMVEDWKNYELHQFPWGSHAWKYIGGTGKGLIPHFCCAACKTQNVKSVMNHNMSPYFLNCPMMGNHTIQINPAPNADF